MIDSIVVSEIIEDAKVEGGIVKARASVNKIYGRISSEASSNDEDDYGYNSGSDNMQPPTYMQPDETGIAGIAPMN